MVSREEIETHVIEFLSSETGRACDLIEGDDMLEYNLGMEDDEIEVFVLNLSNDPVLMDYLHRSDLDFGEEWDGHTTVNEIVDELYEVITGDSNDS